MVIGIDVDSTIVDTLTLWVEWYKYKTGHDLADIINNPVNNLQDLMIQNDKPLQFWKSDTLYDNLDPELGSVNVIKTLQSLGHDIIFVSHCFPSHIDSKISFLDRHFGPDIKFIDTKHKEYIKMDMFIDDYSKFIYKVRNKQPECIVIQRKIPISEIYTDLYFNDWCEFLDKFKDIVHV